MAETTIDSTGTVPGISRLSVSTNNSRGDDNVDSETVVTDGFCRFDEVINQCLLDGPKSSVHSSRSTGDTNDEEENETNIIDVDESINEDDKVEGGASNLSDSSDDEVWREWLDANGGDPFVDDSIDENVGEEAREHLLLLREMLLERLERFGNILADLNSEYYVNSHSDYSETDPATKQQIDAEEAFDGDEVEGADSNMNDSSDEQEGQERIECLMNNFVNVEGGASNLDVFSSVEMLWERLERIENIIADINWENSSDSNSDDFETGPATPQQIDALPTSVVSQELLGLFSKDFCSICFGEFELDQEIKHPPCAHIFHTECLSTWLGKDRRCPYCRMSCIA